MALFKCEMALLKCEMALFIWDRDLFMRNRAILIHTHLKLVVELMQKTNALLTPRRSSIRYCAVIRYLYHTSANMQIR